ANPSENLFADHTAELEPFDPVGRADLAPYFNGSILQLGHMQVADPAVPIVGSRDDVSKLGADLFHWNAVVEIQKGPGHDIAACPCPVEERVLHEVAQRHDHSSQVPDFQHDVRARNLLDAPQLSLHDQDVVEANHPREGDLDARQH